MKLTVGFYTEGLPIGANILEEKSLGGSESAFIYAAREFAKLGHDVKVFCNLDLDYNNIRKDKFGINWFSISEFPQLNMMFKFDVFFCYRYYNIFKHKINSRLNILVNHDILANHNALMEHVWQVDQLFNLSEFHVNQYLEKLPELKSFIWQTKNGVDIENIMAVKAPEDGRKNQFVYASRPERGLERLLIIWDELRQKLPDYKLVICGYDLGKELMASLPKEQIDYYKQLDELVHNSPNIIAMGSLNKQEYWALLKSSKAMLYPTHFPEISCINSLESMLCGTPIITTEDFALKETIGDNGILIKGDPDSDGYKQSFIDKTCRLVNDQKVWSKLSSSGHNWVQSNYKWSSIIKNWVIKCEELLLTRFNRNKKRVLKNLIYHSDLVAARVLAKEYGEHDAFKEADDLIQKATEYKEEYDTGISIVLKGKDDLKYNSRFAGVIEWIEQSGIKYLLDIGCHFGSFAISASNCLPELKIFGIDISSGCIEEAKKLKDEFAKYKENLDFAVYSLESFDIKNKAEAVFVGELLEHIPDTQEAIKNIESCVIDDGWIFMTIPSGPWEAMSFRERSERFHVHHFEMQDLKDLFWEKKDFLIRFIPASLTKRGELVGWWLVKYRKTKEGKTGIVDYERKKFTRPYNTVSCGIITYNEEDNISKCLKSLIDVADEIVICDTGSEDDTINIAKKFTDKIYSIGNNPDGDGLFNFAWARNQALKHIREDSDWFLWVDADEELIQGDKLRSYLDSVIYLGYVIPQHHLILDMKDVNADTPVRIFKTNCGVSFYGVIHEQAMQSLNEHIHPTLVLPKVKVAHYGYTTESVRRNKCANRNLRLLMKDRRLNPDREISLVLLMRDYLNVAGWEIAANSGPTEKVIEYLRTACLIWNEEFRYKPKHIYYALAFSLYQSILEKLASFGASVKNKGLPPLQIAFTLAGAVGGLRTKHFESKFYWFEDEIEYGEHISAKRDELIGKLYKDQNSI